MQTWIPNALLLVQAVLAPTLYSASDLFQTRKILLIGGCIFSFIGAAIIPTANDINRVIAGQALIGVGFSTSPISYCIPSEILPRKWRPLVGATASLAITGAFILRDTKDGWRNFYWIQISLWGLVAVAIFVGYRPSKRHSRLDQLSCRQKIAEIDLIGSGLLTTGLALLLSGMTLGGDLYAWTNSRVICTIVVGRVILVAFGLYETYIIKTGILPHSLFRSDTPKAGRNATICILLIAVEGFVSFAYFIFFPALTATLFETRPMLIVARLEAFWGGIIISSSISGLLSSRMRSIREPLAVGLLLFTAGNIGLATVQPDDSVSSVAFAALTGLGCGVMLVLVVAGIQLSVPHKLIATSTAVIVSVRAVFAVVATAVFAAAFRSRLTGKLPAYVAQVAL
ncbi:hypothetical protein LTR84_005821 [Exophiala bonariae]|uniref:Major facilitator superfamily (MFS) profile domain-containing protein n=1 Tax=Exophiala bonariae TaxID=1690606 RepID=A0AAV9N4B0_9EURO|nr:hypothetical protein LTR84_005821 [Exophiala bonariae]